MRFSLPCLFLVMLISTTLFGQVQMPDLYQYNYSSINPAFVGIDGPRITTFGNVMKYRYRTDRYSAFAGFENTVGRIGFGLSATSSNEELPLRQVNVPFNYQWKLGETRMIAVGAKLSLQHTSFDYSTADYMPLTPDDPFLNASGTITQTGWTTGIGALYRSNRFFSGFSIDNVVHIKRSYNFLPNYTQYHLMIGRNFAGKSNLEYSYSLYSMLVGDFVRVDINNNVLIKRKVIAGASVELSNDMYAKVNAGYRFGNMAQLVISLYSMKSEDKNKHFSGQMFFQFNLNRQPGED